MVDMEPLNHATLLWNLQQRYREDKIYTFVGPTLLCVNPFKPVKHYLLPEVVERYKKIIKAKSILIVK